GHIERTSVSLSQYGYAIGPDFVRYVSSSSNPICSDADSLNPALGHNHPGHVVTYYSYVDPGLLQLERCQPGALQHRTCLIGEDAQLDASLLRQIHRRKRCTILRRSQAAGVAMREDAHAVLEQRERVLADESIRLLILGL